MSLNENLQMREMQRTLGGIPKCVHMHERRMHPARASECDGKNRGDKRVNKNVSFSVDGKNYPVVMVGSRFVLCLPEEEFGPDAGAVVMCFSFRKMAEYRKKQLEGV